MISYMRRELEMAFVEFYNLSDFLWAPSRESLTQNMSYCYRGAVRRTFTADL